MAQPAVDKEERTSARSEDGIDRLLPYHGSTEHAPFVDVSEVGSAHEVYYFPEGMELSDRVESRRDFQRETDELPLDFVVGQVYGTHRGSYEALVLQGYRGRRIEREGNRTGRERSSGGMAHPDTPSCQGKI